MALDSFVEHFYKYLDLLNLCFLFTVTCFVNKYVLSVLKFTYPTIFQGWQTLVGAIFIQMKIMLGHINPFRDGFNKQILLICLPELLLFVMSIYSRSRALSNISIPAFLAIGNIFLLVKRIGRCVLHKTLMLSDPIGWLIYTILAITVLGVLKTDPMYHHDGYFWMSVYLSCLGAIFIYCQINKDILEMSKTKLLFSNYIFSIFMLAPSCFLLGDAADVVNFESLYLYRFYLGCFLSGVFGVLLNLHQIKLQDSKVPGYSESIHLAQIIASFFSVALFDFHVTNEHVLWILGNQICALFIVIYWKYKHGEQ